MEEEQEESRCPRSHDGQPQDALLDEEAWLEVMSCLGSKRNAYRRRRREGVVVLGAIAGRHRSLFIWVAELDVVLCLVGKPDAHGREAREEL